VSQKHTHTHTQQHTRPGVSPKRPCRAIPIAPPLTSSIATSPLPHPPTLSPTLCAPTWSPQPANQRPQQLLLPSSALEEPRSSSRPSSLSNAAVRRAVRVWLPWLFPKEATRGPRQSTKTVVEARRPLSCVELGHGAVEIDRAAALRARWHPRSPTDRDKGVFGSGRGRWAAVQVRACRQRTFG